VSSGQHQSLDHEPGLGRGRLKLAESGRRGPRGAWVTGGGGRRPGGSGAGTGGLIGRSRTPWQFLSTEAYWGRWRTRSVVEQQLDGAWRVVGVYDSGTGAMIGFARAVSDGTGFAYLADVYIDKEFRGQGLGVELVATMIDRGPGASFRWTLHTSDAHGLYERFGFTQPDRTYLERPGTPPTPEHSVTRPGPEPGPGPSPEPGPAAESPGMPPATR